MVTLCIMLLLGGFTLHGLIDQKHRHDRDGLQENFIDLLYSARSAAVIQSSEVIVCPLRTERSTLLARPSCGKRNQWQLGVLAFTDFNRNRPWMTTNTLSLSCQASTPPLFAGALFVTALICDLPLKV